ncbi:MAG: PLP-dependent aminotransferase family protein [Myxococcaceae bacterium]|nr:PLP-dependent aminotransferase family protein [Myxococcaceae bacterium]
MRGWDFPLELDRRSGAPLTEQLVNALVAEIRRGRLEPGAALPGTRTLAKGLGVHRNTVVAAFEELRTQGWVETSRASHTRVSRALALPERVDQGRRGEALGFPLRPVRNSSRRFEAAPAGVLDFTGGLPDDRLFPTALLARAYRRAVAGPRGRPLAFGDPAGSPALRKRLAQLLSSRRGLSVGPDDVLVTRGSQLALHLLALALVKPGDVVAVESPGYPSAREAFALMGAHLMPVPVDREGLDVEALERKLERTRIRALYVTPQHQDPTTVTLSAPRRQRLLALARRHRFAIIEADYDHEFSLDGAPVLPMASSDQHGVVVYVGTLSKALAPGLRMGFVVGPRALRERLLALRGQVDRVGDLGLENAVAELLDDGEVQRHTLRARRVFRARRDVLVAALRRELGEVVDFEVPRGGLALWVTVKRGIDVERWAARALAQGVRFFTGALYSPEGRTLSALRLGFGALDETELQEAVRRMARAL